MQNPAHEFEPRGRQEPDKSTVVKMIRQAVGPKLDALSQATDEAKEAKRLLELAHWAGDQDVEMAIEQALVMLSAATYADG
jgi:hypothetical protein